MGRKVIGLRVSSGEQSDNGSGVLSRRELRVEVPMIVAVSNRRRIRNERTECKDLTSQPIPSVAQEKDRPTSRRKAP